MAGEEMISVLMATYDGEEFLAEAIGSVLDQRGVELELVITDDGSTDRTPTIARAFGRQDARVRFAVQAHAGAAAARNRCLARACGGHIAFLDQDDRWPPGKLSGQLSRLEAAPELAAVFGLTQMFGAASETGSAGFEDPGYTMLLSAGLLRRQTADAVGGFDPSCATADDLDFLLRMLEADLPLELDSRVGVLYRRHPAQASADGAAVRRDCVRALARSLARRREQGAAGPIRHPLLAALG